MSSMWQYTRASLDDSLVLLDQSLGKLKAAKSVDVAEIIKQFEVAAESARNLRSLVSSEMPEASWQNRDELDALIEKIQRNIEARAIEQLRNRLLGLATELERGSVVHRRAVRATQVTQLRDQAVGELRSQAAAKGTPQTLPGPDAQQWITWACALKEPEDTESLQTLRNSFPHLDDFVANLEPDMWVPKTEPPD
jgi:hypothetical protein